MAKAQAPAQQTSPLRQGLPFAGLAVGLWAAIAPYAVLGPDLNASARNEFADHVVPGALLIVLSAVTLWRTRRGTEGGSFQLLAGFGILLAGLWMTATHVPLVKDARHDIVPIDVTVWHALPGLVVMILGGLWAATYWSEGDAPAT